MLLITYWSPILSEWAVYTELSCVKD